MIRQDTAYRLLDIMCKNLGKNYKIHDSPTSLMSVWDRDARSLKFVLLIRQIDRYLFSARIIKDRRTKL